MYVVSPGNEHCFSTKVKIFAIKDDDLKIENCVMCLVNFLGSLMWTRWERQAIYMDNGTPLFERKG